MSAHDFNFPPPPPPPPLATSNYTPNVQGSSFGVRGNRGGRGFRSRGQGAGRRGFGSAHIGSIGSSVYQRNDNQIPNSNGQFPPGGNYGNGYPLPNYPPFQQPQYSESSPNGYGHQSSNCSPATISPAPSSAFYGSSQRHQQYSGNSHSAAYPQNPPTYNVSYPTHEQSYNYESRPSGTNNPTQPLPAGPPIRIGFDINQQRGYQQAPFQPQTYPQQYQNKLSPYPHNARYPTQQSTSKIPSVSFHPNRRDPTNQFSGHRSRGQKREHQDAFGEARVSNLKNHSKTQVAPAVPSFGIPLPVRPPTPETVRKPKKKKRRHNQLGLTPKSVEHESSEEDENDIDEEAKLSAAANLANSELQQLKFTYKGQTSILRSAGDIELWLAERKKRFPTKARLEERKKEQRELNEARRAARKDKESTVKFSAELKEKQKADVKADAKSKRREEAKNKRKEQAREKNHIVDKGEKKAQILPEEQEANMTSDSVAAKAKLKMEKLRRLLEKEERRVARAEAKVARLKFMTNNHAGSAESPPLKAEKIERSDSVETEKGNQIKSQTDIKLEMESPIKIDEVGLLKVETSDTTHRDMMNIAEGGIESTSSEDKVLEATSKMLDPLTPTSQPSQSSLPEHVSNQDLSSMTVRPVTQNPNIPRPIDHNPKSMAKDLTLDTSVSPVSSSESVSSLSSSSISISSDLEDDTSDDSSSSSTSSSAPDQRPLKRTQPSRVAPTRRPKTKTICRNFLQRGRCKKGRMCRFRHELPERGNLATIQRNQLRQARREGKRERMSLHQRLVEQEKQKEQQEKAQAEEHLQRQSVANPIKEEDAAKI